MKSPRRQVECTIPVLPVRDLGKSRDFYQEMLGFRLDWGGGPDDEICSVSRDGCCLMLSRREGDFDGVWVWIGLEDESLFEACRSRGVKVRQMT